MFVFLYFASGLVGSIAYWYITQRFLRPGTVMILTPGHIIMILLGSVLGPFTIFLSLLGLLVLQDGFFNWLKRPIWIEKIK